MSDPAGRPRASALGPIALSEHPRASRHIRLAKGWGGLLCFVIAFLLSSRAGVPTADAALRALLAGLAGMLACWAAAVAVWRQLAIAEVEAAHRRIQERRAEAQAARAVPVEQAGAGA